MSFFVTLLKSHKLGVVKFLADDGHLCHVPKFSLFFFAVPQSAFVRQGSQEKLLGSDSDEERGR